MSEMRERELHNCFYTGSLNHKTTSSLPGQLELGFHYIQKFYKLHTKITLLSKETHKIFDSHKNLDTYPARITHTDLKSHQANQPEAQVLTWEAKMVCFLKILWILNEALLNYLEAITIGMKPTLMKERRFDDIHGDQSWNVCSPCSYII